MAKFKVEEPLKLNSWKEVAIAQITRWLDDEAFVQEICDTTMTNEYMGPFTKFLYHFAWMCDTGWGVMIDFNDKSQRIYLTNHYYQWMHKVRDEIIQRRTNVHNSDPNQLKLF